MNEQQPQNPTEKQHPMKAQADGNQPSRFTFVWRTSGLTANAKSIAEMIAALEATTDALRMLKEAGVVLDAGRAAGDDAQLITTDPAVAERFGFQRDVPEKKTRAEAQADNTTDAKAGQ